MNIFKITLLLFISNLTFSQTIPFKILGKFTKEKIEYLDVLRNPDIKIDTIIKGEHEFEIIGKLNYPDGIEIVINKYQAGYGVFCDGGTLKVIYEDVQDITSTQKKQVIIPKKIIGNNVSISTNRIIRYFRKVKFQLSPKRKEELKITKKIERHLNKYPDSYSNLALIGANLEILSVDKILTMMQKLPLTIQKSSVAPWIYGSIALRQHNFIGKKISNFSIEDSLGVKHSIIDSTKEFTLIQFWDSNCRPCRMMNRELAKNLSNYDLDKVAFVSVSLDREKDDWIKAIKKDQVTWLQLIENQSFDSEIVKYFKFDSIPFDLLIDKNMKIVSLGFDKSLKEIEKYKK